MHDQTAHEDIGHPPVRAGDECLCHAAQRAVDRAEARSDRRQGTHARAGRAVLRLALLAAALDQTYAA